MPKIYVKDSGSWKQVLRIWVKQAGTWKGVAAGLVTSGGIGRQFYPDTIGTIVYSAAGTYSYVVPAGVTQLEITYPTLTGTTTQTVSVTAGATYTVTIGGYGSGSSFGTLLTPGAYTKTIASFSGNVDSQVYTYWGVATAAGNTTYSGSGVSGALSAGAAAAGCYYNESDESGHGDIDATISINTAKTSTLVAPLDVAVINFSGRGESGVSITQQPTAGNGYVVVARAYDGGYSEGGQSWSLQLRQIVSLQIKAIGANYQNYTSGGTYSFTVPAGVTSLSATVYGGGGGSGACNNNGDAWVGGGGGAGGKASSTFAVTPGETLTFEVGAKGYGASSRFNGSYWYNPNNGTLGTGTNGGNTAIKRGSTVLVSANGGTGGVQYGYGVGGSPTVAGTSPPGHTGDGDGEQGSTPGYKGYGYQGLIRGGTNGSGTPPAGYGDAGTGYGNGGGHGNFNQPGCDGQHGAILLSW